jgi:hypothetical protein
VRERRQVRIQEGQAVAREHVRPGGRSAGGGPVDERPDGGRLETGIRRPSAVPPGDETEEIEAGVADQAGEQDLGVRPRPSQRLRRGGRRRGFGHGLGGRRGGLRPHEERGLEALDRAAARVLDERVGDDPRADERRDGRAPDDDHGEGRRDAGAQRDPPATPVARSFPQRHVTPVRVRITCTEQLTHGS